MTNFERIKAMSVESLALELRYLMIYPIKGSIRAWLESEVQDAAD